MCAGRRYRRPGPRLQDGQANRGRVLPRASAVSTRADRARVAARFVPPVPSSSGSGLMTVRFPARSPMAWASVIKRLATAWCSAGVAVLSSTRCANAGNAVLTCAKSANSCRSSRLTMTYSCCPPGSCTSVDRRRVEAPGAGGRGNHASKRGPVLIACVRRVMAPARQPGTRCTGTVTGVITVTAGLDCG